MRRYLTELGRAEQRVVNATIAANEALTNAVSHAYRNSHGDIHVGVYSDDINVHVTVPTPDADQALTSTVNNAATDCL